MKKKVAVLLALYALLLAAGLAVNLQRGLHLFSGFWKQEAEFTFVHAGGDRILYDPAADQFELELEGNRTTAARKIENGSERFDFSDGWAMVLEDSPDLSFEAGGIYFLGEAKLILTDVSAADLHFERAGDVMIEPFYDENGALLGETQVLLSESGVFIDSSETWYNGGFSSEEKNTVVLKDGAVIDSGEAYRTLYQNENGEYLIDRDDLFMIRAGGEEISKQTLIGFLQNVMNGESERRGEPMVVFLFSAIYWLGAAGLLWPQQMAFFGSRWQYRNEPELSDAGLLAAQCGAVFGMILSVLMLLVPIFG